MIPRKIWTPEEQATLVALHAQGNSLFAIARQLKRTQGAIIWRAKTLGLHFPFRPRKVTPKTQDKTSRFDRLF